MRQQPDESSDPQPASSGHCLCFKICLSNSASYMHHAVNLFTGRLNSLLAHLLDACILQCIRRHVCQDTCSDAELQTYSSRTWPLPPAPACKSGIPIQIGPRKAIMQLPNSYESGSSQCTALLPICKRITQFRNSHASWSKQSHHAAPKFTCKLIQSVQSSSFPCENNIKLHHSGRQIHQTI